MSSPPQALDNALYDRKIVRRAWAADLEAIMALARGIPAVAQWSRADYATYCSTGQEAETQAKVLFVACLPAQCDTPCAGKEVVGFAAFSAIPHAGGGECELENMAVAERWRRQGIAGRLLAAGLLWCRAWCTGGSADAASSCGLSLEVRAANLGAIAFYGRAGFTANGRRAAYYKQPDDDAILMWRSLDTPLETH